MKNNLNNDTLILYFEGELNSSNAEEKEKEIFSAIEGKKFSTLILDFSSLTYVSSAGLRIILKLKNQYDNLKIVEASLEVYDVLQMTGFINILTVEKALKKISVEGAEIVGEGFFSTVYRIDGDTIIKVFNRTSDKDQISRELRLAKEAFILGIPTAISFDIVRVDDKLGVRFEMLDCDSLKNVFLKNPDKYDELTDKYANLLKKINNTETDDKSLKQIKDFYYEKLDLVKDSLTDEEYAKMHKFLDDIQYSNNFVHGDCHFKNIMVQNDELLLIDMDTLSLGSPLFELAQIYCPYVAFEEDDPGNTERFLGVNKDFASKLFYDLLSRDLGDDEETLNKIKIIAYLHMMWWTRMNQKENEKRFNGCKSRLINLLRNI